MSRAGLWFKMFIAGSVMCIGGPALVYSLTPTPEELFQKYNPDLQRRSLANREATQEDFDQFVGKLKEYSRSKKPIWEAAADDEERVRREKRVESERTAEAIRRRREEIRRQSLGDEQR